MLYNPFDTFTEELIEPYANLFVGQSMDIHYEFDQHEPLRNVLIGHISEPVVDDDMIDDADRKQILENFNNINIKKIIYIYML